MKNINDLEKKLGESLELYRKEAHSLVSMNGNDNLNQHDMEQIFRQTFYVLDDFKKAIVEYLKDQE